MTPCSPNAAEEAHGGEVSGGDPLGPGMATVWGIGLGFSGLLAVEFFGERIRAMLTALMGGAK